MKSNYLIRKWDPSYLFRWEIYDNILKRLISPETRWLDAGCGMNLAVLEFPCSLNVGMDTGKYPSKQSKSGNYFVQGNLEQIPFRDSAFSLITLNTVVEHLEKPELVFREIHRILSPGGYLLINTTNIRSPLIFLGKILPQKLRSFLFTHVFGATDDEVFPTYHRANTALLLKNLPGFSMKEFHAVQDINRHNPHLLWGFLIYHMLSRIPGLWRIRTNFVVLLEKDTLSMDCNPYPHAIIMNRAL